MSVGEERLEMDPVRQAFPWTPLRVYPEASAGAELRPAGFWRRGIALLVDLVVVSILWQAGEVAALPLARYDLIARAFLLAYRLVMPPAYFVLMHGTGGQTLGKRLVGARVLRTTGEPIGYPRALGRLVAASLAAALLGLGFVAAALRRDRRALHDLLAGTRVVRVA